MPRSAARSSTTDAERRAEHAATELLRDFEARFDVGPVPPVPVERIAESYLGLLIEEIDDVRALPGAAAEQGALSGMFDPDTQTIWLDRREAARSRGRRRFTIAHECGHRVLHAPQLVRLACTPADIGDMPPFEPGDARQLQRREAEAHAFAQALLMPEILINQHVKETGCNLPALAARFDVSVPAMRLRLTKLGLVLTGMSRIPVVGETGADR